MVCKMLSGFACHAFSIVCMLLVCFAMQDWSGHPPKTVPSVLTPNLEPNARSTEALCARAGFEGTQALLKGSPTWVPHSQD